MAAETVSHRDSGHKLREGMGVSFIERIQKGNVFAKLGGGDFRCELE